MDLKFSIDLNKEEIKKQIEANIENYELPSHLVKEDVVNKATNEVFNREVINKSISYIISNYGNYKKFECKEMNVTYYINFPDYNKQNVLNSVNIRQYNNTDSTIEKSITLPVEAIQVLNAYEKKVHITIGNLKAKSEEEFDDINKLIKNGVIQANKVEETKLEFIGLSVKNFGSLLQVYATSTISHLVTISIDEYGFVFSKIMYSTDTNSFQAVETIKIIYELGTVISKWFTEMIETYKKNKPTKQQEKEIQLMKLKRQITLLEEETKKLEEEIKKEKEGK